MKVISEKSMLVLAALTLGLIIAWLIVSDQTPGGTPALVSTAEAGIAIASDATPH